MTYKCVNSYSRQRSLWISQHLKPLNSRRLKLVVITKPALLKISKTHYVTQNKCTEWGRRKKSCISDSRVCGFAPLKEIPTRLRGRAAAEKLMKLMKWQLWKEQIKLLELVDPPLSWQLFQILELIRKKPTYLTLNNFSKIGELMMRKCRFPPQSRQWRTFCGKSQPLQLKKNTCMKLSRYNHDYCTEAVMFSNINIYWDCNTGI